jgi:high-affinity Fe2+/Pb2+ permease
MISLAIGILWLAIGVIVLGGVIFLALWGVRQIVTVPPNVEKAIWAVFLILVLIYLLMAVEGGSLPHPNLLQMR